MSFLHNLFSLEGQTALVTGGTRGIGRAMALALAQAGADIILILRNASLQVVQAEIQAHGVQCHVYEADLASRDSLSAVIHRILAEHDRISILLTAAGVQTRYAPQDFPMEAWDDVLQINLNAVFHLCRDIGAHMLKQPVDPRVNRRGSIINIASLLSFQGGINVPAYAASKGGVAQLTKALSNQWAGQGITVNAIAPGYIATEMNTALMNDPNRRAAILDRIPAGRWGQPDDFDGVVVWLAGRGASYVTGEIVTVDGGWMGR